MAAIGPERHQADGGFQTIATECERLKVDRRSIPIAEVGRAGSVGRKPPPTASSYRGIALDSDLLRNLDRIINLDAEIAHGAFDLGVSEQELNRPQVASSMVDEHRKTSFLTGVLNQTDYRIACAVSLRLRAGEPECC